MQIQRVLVADQIDGLVIDLLTTAGVTVDVKTGLSEAQLIQIIAEYDAVIVRSSVKITAGIIQAGKKLKVIGRAGVGVDNIDVKAASDQGVLVINSPTGNTIAACELTCALILDVSRHVAPAAASMKSGRWDRKLYTGIEVYGKTLAIIGLGQIGREVAIRMKSFGMKIVGYDPIVTPDKYDALDIGFVQGLTLEEIWPIADIITVHVPLIPETKNMLDARTISKCKKGVRIINVARGGIVNESDLLTALESGHVAAAGLDVYEKEPPTDLPLIQNVKVTCTPHLGASTSEAQSKVAKDVAEQMIQLKNGATKVHGAVNLKS